MDTKNLMVSLKRDQRGQILAAGALSMLALVMFFFSVVNMGRLARDRVIATNGADAVVHGAVTLRARGLNILQFLNSLNAGVMMLNIPVMGGYEKCWWMPDPTTIGPFTPVPEIKKSDTLARAAAAMTKATAAAMAGINSAMGGGWLMAGGMLHGLAEENKVELGSTSYAGIVGGIASGMWSYRLKGHTPTINFYGTTAMNMLVVTPSATFPIWLPLPTDPIEVNFGGGAGGPLWYTMDGGEENFAKKKIWLQVSTPSISPIGSLINFPSRGTAAVAAGRTFNESGGPGFPDEGTSNPFTAFDAAMVKSRPKWNAMLVPVDKLGIQH